MINRVTLYENIQELNVTLILKSGYVVTGTFKGFEGTIVTIEDKGSRHYIFESEIADVICKTNDVKKPIVMHDKDKLTPAG
jgi:hypothetical protein